MTEAKLCLLQFATSLDDVSLQLPYVTSKLFDIVFLKILKTNFTFVTIECKISKSLTFFFSI